MWSLAQARKKLYERGCRICTKSVCSKFFIGPPQASKDAQVLKKLMGVGGGGGGDSDTFFPFLKILGQFSRHGVGVSSYITNKRASKKIKVFISK